MSKQLIAVLAAVVAIAASAGGCGSSDDDSTEGTASLTKAEFVKQGDAICKQGDDEINSGFEDFRKEKGIAKNQEPSDAEGVEFVETVIVPSIKSQSERIRALGAPEGDEEQVEELLDSLDDAVAEAEADPEILFADEPDPFRDVNKQAQEYGLKVCGQS